MKPLLLLSALVILAFASCDSLGNYDPVKGERIGRAIGSAYSSYYAPAQPQQPAAPIQPQPRPYP